MRHTMRLPSDRELLFYIAAGLAITVLWWAANAAGCVG